MKRVLTVLFLFNSLFFVAQEIVPSESLRDSLYKEAKRNEDVFLYKVAYENYKVALSVDTTDIEVLEATTRMALNLGKMEESNRYIESIIRLDSMNFFATYQQGRLWAQNGEYDKAIECFEKLQDRDTTIVNPILARNIGDCYFQKEDLVSASHYYILGFEANPENVSLANSSINCLIRLGGLAMIKANEICNEALKYSPDNRELLSNKAKMMYMNRQYPESEEVYELLLSKGDSSFNTLKYGGASRYMNGKYVYSLELLEAAYAKDTTDVEINLLLGAALGRTVDRRRALVLFDQAEELMKPAAALANLLLVSRGETLIRDGQNDKGSVLFYDGWKNDKSHLDYLVRIDQLYPNTFSYYKDDSKKAKALFIKTLFLSEALKNKKAAMGYTVPFKPFLQAAYEEAFFQNTQEIPTIAPDGRKSTLKVEDLKILISKIPEKTNNLESE